MFHKRKRFGVTCAYFAALTWSSLLCCAQQNVPDAASSGSSIEQDDSIKPGDETRQLQGKSFLELRELLTEYQRDIQTQKSKIDALTQELQDRDAAESNVQQLERLLADSKNNKAFPKELKNVYEQRAAAARNQLPVMRTAAVITQDIQVAKRELNTKQKKLSDLEAYISQAINLEKPRQDFKRSITITFSVLVGTVILGFFVIAFRDESVRRSIFGGQAGIQFITLFALVIAIILFGVTDILQDKELSALLGGLSGYILGRGTQGNSSRNESSPDKGTPAGEKAAGIRSMTGENQL